MGAHTIFGPNRDVHNFCRDDRAGSELRRLGVRAPSLALARVRANARHEAAPAFRQRLPQWRESVRNVRRPRVAGEPGGAGAPRRLHGAEVYCGHAPVAAALELEAHLLVLG